LGISSGLQPSAAEGHAALPAVTASERKAEEGTGRAGHLWSQGWAMMVGVSVGEELLEERRRRRRAGDPRLSDADREFLGRLTDGDLAEDFQAALDAVSAADPLIGGSEDGD
jgi:hypothetical protein